LLRLIAVSAWRARAPRLDRPRGRHAPRCTLSAHGRQRQSAARRARSRRS